MTAILRNRAAVGVPAVLIALGAVCSGLGLLTFMVGLGFYGLMNACWVCL